MVTNPINRGGAGEIETFAMANCLMLLSSQATGAGAGSPESVAADQNRMYGCKTCGKKFPSFQALGGHRASHNKHKPTNSGDFSDGKSPAPAKSKNHACSICGLEFPIGQALGGHMRKHRAIPVSTESTLTTEVSIDNSDDNLSEKKEDKKRKNDDVVFVPAVKKSSVCLDLLLNFSPLIKKFVDDEVEEGEIVEQEEEKINLELELRQPIH